MSAIDKNRLISFVKITVLIFLMGKNHKCPGYCQHPFDTCQWIVLRVSLRYAAHCWFNAGQLCTTLAQHLSNTDRTHDSSTPASTAITGRLSNVASMLIQRVWRWPNNNPVFCIHRLLCGNFLQGWQFYPPWPERPLPRYIGPIVK